MCDRVKTSKLCKFEDSGGKNGTVKVFKEIRAN